MFPSQFTYLQPTSVQDAIQLIASDPEAKVLAGGHSLIPAMKLRLAMPGTLVDIGKIPGLSGIAVNGDVQIGAMTTYAELLTSSELQAVLPIIAETAHHVGDPQVRSRGTLGGALAHSDPAADYTAVALALDARVTAVGPSGEREIPIDDFFQDIFTTALAPEEILTKITIPTKANTFAAYEKIEHPASGYAIVGVAVALTIENGTCTAARVAVTGCTSKATRASGAEAALTGTSLDAATLKSASGAVASGLELNGDSYASAEYRRHLLSVVAARVFAKAIERAGA